MPAVGAGQPLWEHTVPVFIYPSGRRFPVLSDQTKFKGKVLSLFQHDAPLGKKLLSSGTSTWKLGPTGYTQSFGSISGPVWCSLQ